jgi:hypothetical protein
VDQSANLFEEVSMQPDSSNTIKVIVRVRPASQSEQSGQSESVRVVSRDTVMLRLSSHL